MPVLCFTAVCNSRGARARLGADKGHQGIAEGKNVTWLRGVGDIVSFMHDLLDVLDEEDRSIRRRRRSSLPRTGSYNQLRDGQRQTDLKTEHMMPRPDSGASVEDWVAQANLRDIPEEGSERQLVLVGHSTSGMHVRLFCHR